MIKEKLFQIIIFITVLILSIFLHFLLATNLHAEDDYSSDFEYEMMEWEQTDDVDCTIHPKLGEYSPSAQYNAVRENQKLRRVIDEIYKRQKFGYIPYSKKDK